MCQDSWDQTAVEFEGETAAAQPLQPTPVPIDFDWWRCLRIGGISGRYDGTNGKTGSAARALDLRIDVDRRYANSPVMNKVSGDFYKIQSIFVPAPLPAPGPPVPAPAPAPGPIGPILPRTWRVYQESWIVDNPKLTWSRCKAVITGAVRFWKGIHLYTTVEIVVTWALGSPTVASVKFSVLNYTETFNCTRTSDCFRSMNMEIDVCSSVNAEPILPAYNTSWLADRPADTPTRDLTLEGAYRETGVCVTIRPERSIVDDSAVGTWSVGELHDAMESYYSQIGATWPRWDMWGMLAGSFTSSGVAGIMFDAAAAYGGSGEPPERQGYAVFRNHSWFTSLVAAPSTNAQKTAMRTYLYTYVHEAGHAFNLLHSWNKGRPDSRSWMNYPHNIAGFYNTFYFRFDDEELIHIRHGDRASVIMGGDPWASGGHMEDSQLGLNSSVDGDAPLEVLVRGKDYFDFLEPVMLEVRLRNLLPGIPLQVDARLEPQYGNVGFMVQRPDGRFVEHDPIFCAVGSSEYQVLQGAGVEDGSDRYSQLVQLTYGKHGFSFAEPGEYRVRAFYRTEDGFVYPSNVMRLRIGRPGSKEEDRLAQDFFSRQVGLLLALEDGRSPFLEGGLKTVETMLDQMKASPAAAAVAMMLAGSYRRPFYRVEAAKGKRAAKQHAKANVKRSLELTEAAYKLLSKESSKAANLPLHQVVRLRAECLGETGQGVQAKKEVGALRADLQKRGVKAAVIRKIQEFEKSL